MPWRGCSGISPGEGDDLQLPRHAAVQASTISAAPAIMAELLDSPIVRRTIAGMAAARR
jgi:hypothetical protein